jgi:hypothetical protein
MYSDISRYTSNIYYICRDQITALVDSHLLTEEQKQEMQKKQIDIYKVISNPFYYEEFKSSGNSRHQDISDLTKTSWPMKYALKSVTPGEDDVNQEATKYRSPQFEIILKAIREYQQMDED